MPEGNLGLWSLLGGSGPGFWDEQLTSSGRLLTPVPTLCLYLFSRHADIPDICVHYMGGLLDALIQGLKEVKTLVQNCGQW